MSLSVAQTSGGPLLLGLPTPSTWVNRNESRFVGWSSGPLPNGTPPLRGRPRVLQPSASDRPTGHQTRRGVRRLTPRTAPAGPSRVPSRRASAPPALREVPGANERKLFVVVVDEGGAWGRGAESEAPDREVR